MGVLYAAALEARGASASHVAGAAHQRPADGLHRPLPVLHEGSEGSRHRRLETALNAITETSERVTNQEQIVNELKKLNNHGRALDVFAAATFAPQETALA